MKDIIIGYLKQMHRKWFDTYITYVKSLYEKRKNSNKI